MRRPACHTGDSKKEKTKGEPKMKAIVKVTGLIALAGAAFFAVNVGSALAGPEDPPDSAVIGEVLPIDPCVFTGTCEDPAPAPVEGVEILPIDPCIFTDSCFEILPIDPCVITDTCDEDAADEPADDGVDESADDGVDESADDSADVPSDDEADVPSDDGSDEPAPTPTEEPTIEPTDEPTTAPTVEPTAAPTDEPPAVAPQPGNLPSAGSDGGLMSDVGGGVVLLAGMSLGAMALAWGMFFASRRREQPER
jgi:hypothetical protein